MARPAPKAQAPDWQEPSSYHTICLQLRLITPLFGGGYEAREVDPVCIIRPATIRGHLRYWWRALYGGQYSSCSQMFEEESNLWGGASDGNKDRAGKVSLWVQQVQWGQKEITVNNFQPRGSPAKVGPEAQYLLYVFGEQKKENIPPAKGYTDVSFTLCVRLHPSLNSHKRQQVENTLKAWIALGGIGARTRRGCGALTVAQQREKWLPPADPKAREQWFSHLAPPSSNSTAVRFTSLPGTRLICGAPVAETQWMKVLHDLGSFWARFRKGHVGKGVTYTPMAGCKWQDYRGALVPFSKRKSDPISLCKPYLGLPIVYQRFKNAPFDSAVEAQDTGRMASPVILKPMALADGRICPVCAVLRAPQPRAVQIQGARVSLQVRKDDQVLHALNVTHPLAAVIVAAEQQWNSRAFTI